MLNITTFLDANSKRLNKNVLFNPKNGEKYTSKEILSIVSEIGRNLKDIGIKKGDRVLIYLNNSEEYLFSLFAIWRIGAIAIPTNRIMTQSELEYIINDSTAKLMITDKQGKDLIKINMLTHGNYFTAIHNECDVLTLKQDDVFLGIYPMAHVGLSWAISALRAAAYYILIEQFNIDEYLKLCEEEKVTVLTGMPPVIHSLTTQDARKYLKTVREIISGGGPLHKKIWKDFHQTYQIPIINAYGLSETIVIGTGTVIRPEDYWEADRFESVGHPVCFSEVKIVDELDSSKILDEYEHGEIALRGPAVAKGYWRNIEKTKSSFLEDGWFLTGDIGYLDSDNRLFITDRKKDMIVMSGWKIYPTEVEEVLILVLMIVIEENFLLQQLFGKILQMMRDYLSMLVKTYQDTKFLEKYLHLMNFQE